jgi:hypothetical protein
MNLGKYGFDNVHVAREIIFDNLVNVHNLHLGEGRLKQNRTNLVQSGMTCISK